MGGDVTAAEKSGGQGASALHPSLLPGIPADLLGMRVRPALFARMVKVSRQTVSRWIADGKVTLGSDGKLDPVKACAQVIERSDPSRIRARVLRDAASTHDELRQRVGELERALQDALATRQSEIDTALFRAEEDSARGVVRVCDALLARFGEAAEASSRGSLAAWLDELVAVEFFELDLETYRRELAGGDACDD